jgi:hypothetical protein
VAETDPLAPENVLESVHGYGTVDEATYRALYAREQKGKARVENRDPDELEQQIARAVWEAREDCEGCSEGALAFAAAHRVISVLAAIGGEGQ